MEMRYNTVLFDLDGTIVDSSPGIFNSLKYAFTEMEREIPDEKTLRKFLGPPLEYSFTQFCGFSNADAKTATELYRSRYKDFCVVESELFSGVREMLAELTDSGVVIALATTKPERFANRILAGLGIERFFTAVCGGELSRSERKETIIRESMRLCGVSNPDFAVMVGDRCYDIDGAKSVGIDSIGVLYGYGSREELETAGATHIASSAEEIVEIINANPKRSDGFGFAN